MTLRRQDTAALTAQGNAAMRYFTRRMDDGSTRARILRGAFWALLGAAGSRVFTVASSVLVARILGRDGFGGYGIVYGTVRMFGVFADLAPGSTATRYVADLRKRDPVRAGRVLGFSAAFAVGRGALAGVSLLALAPWLAAETLHAAHLVTGLRIGALLLLISGLNGVMIGGLAGFENFEAVARVNAVQAVSTPVLAVPLAWYMGLEGVVLAQAAVAAIGVLASRAALVRVCTENSVTLTFGWRFRFDEYRILVRYSLPAFLAGLLVLPVNWYCSACWSGNQAA